MSFIYGPGDVGAPKRESEAYYRAKMQVCGVPEHMQDGLVLYLLNGYAPGGFLTAVLSNNLSEAVGRGDSTNQNALVAYVKFLYNYAPGAAWGSPGKVEAWITSFSVTAQPLDEFETEEV